MWLRNILAVVEVAGCLGESALHCGDQAAANRRRHSGSLKGALLVETLGLA